MAELAARAELAGTPGSVVAVRSLDSSAETVVAVVAVAEATVEAEEAVVREGSP